MNPLAACFIWLSCKQEALIRRISSTQVSIHLHFPTATSEAVVVKHASCCHQTKEDEILLLLILLYWEEGEWSITVYLSSKLMISLMNFSSGIN